MAVIPEPGTCRIYEFPSQRVCGATASAQPTSVAPSPCRLSSPKKRSRQGERRPQHMPATTAPGLWRRPDSGGGSGDGGSGGDGGNGNGGHAEWRTCHNKENIDPRTGRHAQHPFSPSSPFSASLPASAPTTAAAAPALSATAAAAGVTSGSASGIQKRLFCGSGCVEGAQAHFRPAVAISSRKPFGEPRRELWNSRSSRYSG